MAQKIEAKTERPLQTFFLKNFAAVNTVASRMSAPQDACFWDLTNAQPIGFSNLHSINDASAPIYDFGGSRVYADFNVNLNNIERMVIATTDGKLWLYDVGTPGAIPEVVNANLPLSGTDALDIAQYDNNSFLVIDSSGYYYYTTIAGESPAGSREHGMVAISTPSHPDTTGGSPTSGNAIAVYNNMVWIAKGRTLYYSTAGAASDSPPGYANFTEAAAGGWETINDQTLRSDIKALFPANGLLYLFGESSVDAIGNVNVQVTVDTANITHAVTNYTRQNITAIIGTEHVESIVAFGRLVFFCNQMGIWMIYGTTVQQASTDVNNGYMSGIDGTWQYLDFNHYNDAVQWINNDADIVDWENSAPQTVQWMLDNYQPFLFRISGGQVKTNNLFCAAFVVVRKNDPVMGSGNFLVMYQGDASGQNYKWWFADWTADIGPITHVCCAFVNYAPALFGYIGNKLYRFFADPASAPSARVMTALWDFGDPLSDKQALRAGIRVSLNKAQSDAAIRVNLDTLTESYPIPLGDVGTVDWVNDIENLVPWQNNVPTPAAWQNWRNFLYYHGRAPESYSKNLGFTLRTQRGTQFELNLFALDYKVGPRWVGQ